jgi:recombination associated protein RdgC
MGESRSSIRNKRKDSEMSFFNGRVTMSRYSVIGPTPLEFDENHLGRLTDYAVGKQRIASADGTEVGWIASDHILDTDFTREKNIINDLLFFSLRIDTEKFPSDMLKAYYLHDLKAMSSDNPSGRPSARQKREARESARERMEQEAKDGRYRKRKAIEVAWDRRSQSLWFGTTSVTQVDRLSVLMKTTFGVSLEQIHSGNASPCVPHDAAVPSKFTAWSPSVISWAPDEVSQIWLGSEFLLWLWWHTRTVDDTIKLEDGREVTVMIARNVTVDCPRGTAGTDGFRHEWPCALPEAHRALREGKLPRKCGLTLVCQDEQYEINLLAASLSFSGCKLPGIEADNDRERLDQRAEQIRAVVELVQGLYGTFIAKRFGEWSGDLAKIQEWLE